MEGDIGMYNITLTTRGRITIPLQIRKKYGIKGGTRIRFIPDEEHQRIFLIPMTRKYFRSLAGALKPKRGKKSMLKSLMKEKVEKIKKELLSSWNLPQNNIYFIISGKFKYPTISTIILISHVKQS